MSSTEALSAGNSWQYSETTPLDLQADIPEPVAVEPVASNSTVRTQPKRKASLRAQERIASWTMDLKSDND